MSPHQNPVILTYHSISEGPSPLQVSPALFKDQLEWLAANGRVAQLKETVTALCAHQQIPERTAILTFDDGFADFYQNAAPVLLRLKLPATVFLPTSYLGRTNAWPGQPSWVKPDPLMSWEQVRELSAQGIQFGSHTVSHPDLTTLSASDVERELAESKQEIESHTGKPAEFFCYPYGRWNPGVRELVARHYQGACSTAAGILEAGADPFALPRVDAHYVRNPAWFQGMFTRRFTAYIAARRFVRRLRGQPEGFYSRL